MQNNYEQVSDEKDFEGRYTCYFSNFQLCVVVIVISLLSGKYFITKRVVASAQLISLYFILIAKRIYHDSHLELILNVNLE